MKPEAPQAVIAACMQALARKIDDAPTHYRLGVAFRDAGMKLEAAECIRTAVTLGFPDALFARGLLVYLEREGCRWPRAAQDWAELEAAIGAQPEGAALQVNPFVHAVLATDPLAVRRVAEHYARFCARLVKPLPARPAQRRPRIHLAYLSADFQQHATAQLMAQLVESHDRSRFEVSLISAGADDGSALRARLQRGVERFVDVHGLSHAAIAQRIRALGVDVLVDAKGATDGTLLPVLAARPAPLQLNWLAFPGTSGAAYLDYIVGDAIVTPLEHAAHFTEAIAQLPRCYQPNDARRAKPAPSTRADWGAPAQGPLLAGFHQAYKISQEVFERWCAVLHQVPDATLWLLEWNTNVRATLTAAAQARGIGAQRLCFAPLLPLEQHLARLACADVFLDTWPCGAHTTAGEALWCGVPVVTSIGATFAQRVAPSLLHAMGQGDLVAVDAQRYEALAVRLARDAEERARRRTQLLAQRDVASLFDGAGYARDFEALCERLWARACDGLPPQQLAA